MSKPAWQIASELADAAERARQAGDVRASLEIAMVAAQYNQLARLLGDSLPPQN